MSPRPRTVQDDAILDAAVQVLSRVGPEKITLADIGAAVGLSAATLVQRFGSKRELMLALLKHAIGNVDARFEAAMAGHESPLEALFAAAGERPGPLKGPGTAANRLAFYMSQLDDPDFRALAEDNSRSAVEGFRKLLDNAVEAGELSGGYLNTHQLAETIYSMTMGSLVTWTVMSEGSLKDKVRRDLDVLLRPFRRGPRKASAPGPHRAGGKGIDAFAADSTENREDRAR